MISKIRNFLKYRLSNLLIRLKTLYYSFCKSKHKKIFILGVVEHKNFGDFAISEGGYQFIKDNFDARICEFTEEQMSNPLTFNLIEKMLSDQDIIFCQGGGNHGNIYLFHENYRREVIRRFQKNRIVVFPQTYYFTPDENGKKEASISQEIYNSHPDLIIAMRDRLSYSLTAEAYPQAKVIFCPDMVLYMMNQFKKQATDSDLMILFRSGIEEYFSGQEKEELLDSLKKTYSIKFNNHSTNEDVNSRSRYPLIKNQVELYSKSKVVITDKLHGAIFSVLSGTPCIMLKTFNHKLEEVSKLFTSTKGYYYCDDLSKVPELVKEAITVGQCNNPDLTGYYKDFINIIKS